MVNHLRTTDWARTPLGDVEHWPETLRVAVTMLHGSRFPMLVCWGPELTQVYNDAFIPIYGGKHPQLGRRMQDTWAEIWPIIEPMLAGVMRTGVPTWSENELLWIARSAQQDVIAVEDCYFSWSYSRIQEPDGRGAGIYVAATEVTQQVVEDRRARALAAITTGQAATRVQAAGQAAAAMALHGDDVPFACIQLPREDGGGFVPAAATGLGGLPASAVDGSWLPAPLGPEAEIVRLPPGFPVVTHARSGRPVTHAGVVELGSHGRLVCGLSPSRPHDDAHRRFLAALGVRVQAALAAGQTFADERSRSEQRLALVRATIEREAAERSLAISERFRFACRAANVGAWTLDLSTGRTELDENVEVMYGLPRGTLDGNLDDIMRRIDDEDRDAVADAIAAVSRDGGEYVVEYRMTRPDGSRRAFQARGMTTPGTDGRPRLLHGVLWDATDLIAAQTASRESEERLRTALEAATWGSAIIEPDGRIAQVNQALCDLLGYDRDTIVGMCCRKLVHASEGRIRNPGRGSTAARELRLVRADGCEVWAQLSSAPVLAADGTVLHHVVHVHDATERKSFEAELQHLADHDALTGLLNRRRFGEELQRALGEAAGHRRTAGAVIMLDLDGLKAVNDTLGHAVGDALIVTVADILRGRLREADVTARLGGDEFAVIVPGADAASALGLAHDILGLLREGAPLACAQGTPSASACIGIALYGRGREQSDEEVMTQADLALYEAKDAGRGCARVYSGPERETTFRPAVRWTDRVRAALAEDRFVLLGQPIRSLHGDPVDRRELLLRMLGDDGEQLLPSSFLLAAERSSLIQAIDRWVVRRAATELAAHQATGASVSFAVNLSARSMTDPAMAAYVAEAIDDAGADGSGLVFEITETAAVVNVDRARSFAQAITASGCELALDDFGAGFTSFRYLKHLEFDYVKIDGTFVRDLASSYTSQCLVQALAHMAGSLGKRTVAEHVNDDETQEWLRVHGVDYVQGFHVGPPAPIRLPQKSAGSVAGGSRPRWA